MKKENREKIFTMRLTNNEYRQLLENAKKAGYRMRSKYVRDLLLRGSIVSIDPRLLLECSIKLDQLLEFVERGGYPGEVIDKVDELNKLLCEISKDSILQ